MMGSYVIDRIGSRGAQGTGGYEWYRSRHDSWRGELQGTVLYDCNNQPAARSGVINFLLLKEMQMANISTSTGQSSSGPGQETGNLSRGKQRRNESCHCLPQSSTLIIQSRNEYSRCQVTRKYNGLDQIIVIVDRIGHDNLIKPKLLVQQILLDQTLEKSRVA